MHDFVAPNFVAHATNFVAHATDFVAHATNFVARATDFWHVDHYPCCTKPVASATKSVAGLCHTKSEARATKSVVLSTVAIFRNR